MVKEIPLGGGLVALVDDEDYELIAGSTWHAAIMRRPSGVRYSAQRTVNLHNGRYKSIFMSRLITNAPSGTRVLFINNDPLDLRRSNLMVVSKSCAIRHRKKPAVYRNEPTQSKYKGVYRSRGRKGKLTDRWHGQIRVRGQLIHLGTFKTETEAARAYDRAAIRHFGRCAVLNFP